MWEVLVSSFIRRIFSLDIRIRRRWQAQDGIFAVVRGAGKHQVDDIGLGGLSFHYTDDGLYPKQGAYGLSVWSENHSTTIKLKGRTVSDEEVGELIFQNKKIKRRSVSFESISNQQKKALKALIKSNLDHDK